MFENYLIFVSRILRRFCFFFFYLFINFFGDPTDLANPNIAHFEIRRGNENKLRIECILVKI